MKPNFRIGLLGFGAMGKTHAFCVDNLPYYYHPLPFSASVFGVCTRSEQKAAEVAEQFHIPLAVTDEDVLIQHPEIDVIDICTPNTCHYETAKKALAAGKHVLCEKPLCTTRAQAEELAALAGASDKICMTVFNNRHLAPILRAAELIQEGKIGNVRSFSVEYLHNSCTDPQKNAGWKQNRDICGGGVLFDLGSHAIDLIYALCGEFESVYGIPQIAYPQRKGMDGLAWQTNADEAFYMLCRLRNGAVGTVTVSKLIHGANDDLNLAVYGEKGSLKFSLMQPNFLYFYDASEKPGVLGGHTGYQAIECVGRYPEPGGSFPPPKAPSDWLRGHVASMYCFLNAVYTGKPAHPTFADGAYVQAVMEAAYRSAQSHKEEPI